MSLSIGFDWYLAWTGTPSAFARVIPRPATAGAFTDYYLQTNPGINGVWQHSDFVYSAGSQTNQTISLLVEAYSTTGRLATVDLRIDNIQITMI